LKKYYGYGAKIVNKVVVVLGIIVVITLGALFFCAGFFTGSTMPTVSATQEKVEKEKDDDHLPMSNIEDLIDGESSVISEKIKSMLVSASDTAADVVSSVADTVVDTVSEIGSSNKEESKITIDSLLREIAAGHTENDDCSPAKTLQRMNTTPPFNPDSLHGKRIVFIGYFKNKIALEVQKLLTGKGYNVHLEMSKTGDNESFIFCGPFKKEKNAKKLVRWLHKHDFSEARIVSISNETFEETLYDAINEDSNVPVNEEYDIPEIDNSQISLIQNQQTYHIDHTANQFVAPGSYPVYSFPGQ